MENTWFPRWRLICSEGRFMQKLVFPMENNWFPRWRLICSEVCTWHVDSYTMRASWRCWFTRKSQYFLWKIIDFHDGALLARRPDLCKSLYFLRKTNDFQECALFARRFARSMSISVPCAPHGDAGLRRSEAWLEKIHDFRDGALLIRRLVLCKSKYFIRKSNDFQDGG